MRTNLASLRTRWAAIGAAVAVTIGAAGIGSYTIVNADITTGDRPVFVSLNPCRLVDTRAAATVGPKSSPLGPNETITVTAHGSNGNCTGPSAIPTDAVALSLNVTAVGQTQRTFLTIWGEGTDPGTSNLNPEPGQPPTPNAVNTPLSPAGTFNVRNNAGNVNTLIDVVGYYANHNHDDRYALRRETETQTCNAPDFEGGNETMFHHSGLDVANTTFVSCALQAPVGSTLNSLTARVTDQSSTRDGRCEIRYWSNTEDLNFTNNAGLVARTSDTSGDSFESQLLTDDTIDHVVLADRTYAIQCLLTSETRVRVAEVTYTP